MPRTTDFPAPTFVSLPGGVKLEVFEAGHENAGNPIVLCHGWPEHAFSWRHQIPDLAAAGYHVLVPNQRGYGNSHRPAEVTAYGLDSLAGDLIALLDHYGYDDATFVGHDWGAMVVWGLTLLHPKRVNRVIALSVPYLPRGEKPWVEFLEEAVGGDQYIVHFNRQPGVADALFRENTAPFLRNLYRKNLPPRQPETGVAILELATAETLRGDRLLSEEELDVFIAAFEKTGFTAGINWYRNLDRNWHLLADVDPIIRHPALMIYGDQDSVAQSPFLTHFVPNVEIVHLDCGHWIQQELPKKTTEVILSWLTAQNSSNARG
ncbi:MAG: alpha/beta hydrolase [Acidobacteriota bacterium]